MFVFRSKLYLSSCRGGWGRLPLLLKYRSSIRRRGCSMSVWFQTLFGQLFGCLQKTYRLPEGKNMLVHFTIILINTVYRGHIDDAFNTLNYYMDGTCLKLLVWCTWTQMDSYCNNKVASDNSMVVSTKISIFLEFFQVI